MLLKLTAGNFTPTNLSFDNAKLKNILLEMENKTKKIMITEKKNNLEKTSSTLLPP